jgi:hypothetical protein
MNEKEATIQLREWLESNGYFVYTGKEFNVRSAASKRPDMIVINTLTGIHSAIEIKRSRAKDIHKAYKIVNYASDYIKGARYTIDNRSVNITNFLVATEASINGKLFPDDVFYDEKHRKHQASAYDTWGRGRVEPYYEYLRSGEFVRTIWREWKDRTNMAELKIGILLSSINDKAESLKQSLIPKIFVSRYNERTMKIGRWGQQWTEL